MKAHWSLWVALTVLVLILVILSARREGYAPPRDENTQPPYTEDVGNTASMEGIRPYVDSVNDAVRVDNQTDIYKDMAGMNFQIQSGNPILNFIQGDPSSNVMYGDFVPHESGGGSARMYAYGFESNVSAEDNMLSPVPTMRSNATVNREVDIKVSPIMPAEGQYIPPPPASPTTPFLGEQTEGSASGSPVPETSSAEVSVYTAASNMNGGAAVGTPIMPDSGQYIPTMTSPNTPFLGTQSGISALESPASETSPAAAQ